MTTKLTDKEREEMSTILSGFRSDIHSAEINEESGDKCYKEAINEIESLLAKKVEEAYKTGKLDGIKEEYARFGERMRDLNHAREGAWRDALKKD